MVKFSVYLNRRVFIMASVALSDARSNGDREVAGFILAGSGNILTWRLITIFSPLPLIQEVQLSVSGERMCTNTGYPHRRLNLSRKCVVR